jgi:hypothetical protein
MAASLTFGRLLADRAAGAAVWRTVFRAGALFQTAVLAVYLVIDKLWLAPGTVHDILEAL